MESLRDGLGLAFTFPVINFIQASAIQSRQQLLFSFSLHLALKPKSKFPMMMIAIIVGSYEAIRVKDARIQERRV
jgi:hypothetical protein